MDRNDVVVDDDEPEGSDPDAFVVSDGDDPVGSSRVVTGLIVVRCAWIVAAVLLLWFGRGTWHGLTVATVIVGAAWLLGRVD
jgi:hypothetical protein